MEGYLGQWPVEVHNHPVYSKYVQADWALMYIELYGGIDGEHHKTWLFDQVVRILNGTTMNVTTAKWTNGYTEDRFTLGDPSEEYYVWVNKLGNDYDIGIAP